MSEGIKRLPKDFIGKGEVKGFQFHQLLRGHKSCLYKVVTQHGNSHYETFEIRVFKTPKTQMTYEAYPKANSFGVWAWTYLDYNKVKAKFLEIDNNGRLKK